MEKLIIPADVPLSAHEAYREHYSALTKDTGRLFLFAADHKLEHLNNDFFGPGIDVAAQTPEHLFELASKAPIGALATQLGLIARYGKQYPSVNYVVKLNSKTNLRTDPDPFSPQLWSVDDVVAFAKESQLPIRGIGLTIYLGSSSEPRRLRKLLKRSSKHISTDSLPFYGCTLAVALLRMSETHSFLQEQPG